MKRAVIFLLAALLTLTLTGAVSAETGGLFEYRILEDGSAMITGYRGSGAELAFPETLEGHPVSGLSAGFGFNTPAAADLRSISIPKTMTTVEPGALRFAEFLTEIRIPEDHPSLRFADGALYNTEEQSLLLYLQSSKAEAFEVPEGVRELADSAFYRAGLASVSLPGSLERIGRDCFNQCVRMKEILLPDSLRSIGADAFTNCDRLKTIRIPAGVTDIEEGAFTDNHLTEILTDPDNPVFTVTGGALINAREGTLIAYPAYAEAESFAIPEGVKRIGRLAFYRAHHLKQITFPEGLLEIGGSAFISCNHLAAIELPDSLVLLEEAAFRINSDTERLRLPAGLTEIRDNFDDMNIAELVIPEGVTRIERSFVSLGNLTEAVIPGSVTAIGPRAFTYCKNLRSITIPASVTEIGTTFAGCSEELVIRVEAGSYAEQFCRERQLRYEILSE